MLSFYTAVNQGVVLSPICVPEKVGVNEKSINKKWLFHLKSGEGE